MIPENERHYEKAESVCHHRCIWSGGIYKEFLMRLFAKHRSLLAFYYKVLRPISIKVI